MGMMRQSSSFFHGFDDGDASARFVDDDDAGTVLGNTGGHLFKAFDDFGIGGSERDAFGLADDVAAVGTFAAEHVVERGLFIETFDDDDGGVAAALAEVDADEEDAVDRGKGYVHGSVPWFSHGLTRMNTDRAWVLGV